MDRPFFVAAFGCSLFWPIGAMAMGSHTFGQPAACRDRCRGADALEG